MKSVIALSALVAVVSAAATAPMTTGGASVADAPACASTCIAAAKCGTDPACLCGSSAKAVIAPCVATACTNPTDISKLIALQDQCAAATPAAGGSSESVSGSEAAATATATGAATTPTEAAPANGPVYSSGAAAASSAAPVETEAVTPASNGTASGTATGPKISESPTSGAQRVVVGGSAILAAFAAILAL